MYVPLRVYFDITVFSVLGKNLIVMLEQNKPIIQILVKDTYKP